MITWLVYHYEDTIFVEPAAIKYSKDDKYTWDCWKLAETFPLQFYSKQEYFKYKSESSSDPKRHCAFERTKIEYDDSLTVNDIQMWWHCYPSYIFCDTQNSLTPVIFAIEIHHKVTLFKIAYSKDGVFDVTTMFNEINWKSMDEKKHYTVMYAALPHFYDATYNNKIEDDLATNKYSLPMGYRWTKVQTCASCPEQSLQIKRGYSEVQSRTQWLQTAWTLSATGSASTTVSWPGFAGVGLNVGLSASNTDLERNDFTDSFSLGTDISKTIKCKHRNIYLYGLSVTLWSGKTETIPTDYYYCSDRDNPPICIPKIRGNEKGTEQAKYCNGGDAEHDFNSKKKETTMKQDMPKPSHEGSSAKKENINPVHSGTH